MANPLRQAAATTGCGICNAESDTGFVTKSQVQAVISESRAAFENLRVSADLRPDSPIRFTRERWEIVAGKLMALDSIAEKIAALPPAPAENLMAGKPSSLSAVSDVLADVLAVIERRREDAHRSACFFASHLRADGSPCSEWSRQSATESALEFLAVELKEIFSGSAEEQPGRREESRPVIGKDCNPAPVTPAGANPLPRARQSFFPSGASRDLMEWFDLNTESLTNAELAAMSESILLELECRDAAFRWQAV
jgi:hypothetical protein